MLVRDFPDRPHPRIFARVPPAAGFDFHLVFRPFSQRVAGWLRASCDQGFIPTPMVLWQGAISRSSSRILRQASSSRGSPDAPRLPRHDDTTTPCRACMVSSIGVVSKRGPICGSYRLWVVSPVAIVRMWGIEGMGKA
ncbi:unnamed protein product [Tuber aestivum]|uniref:Uncharacterized protein n=1 Tax=Tuber aestivum TaxID=59557 RepID=A0A292PWA7_9PEZI|nr:unnamed protein product [Tuber aestivum]